jgi:hypothetical protein
MRLVDGCEAMQVDITVDDPDAFNAPWSVMQRYDRIQQQMDAVQDPDFLPPDGCIYMHHAWLA